MYTCSIGKDIGIDGIPIYVYTCKDVDVMLTDMVIIGSRIAVLLRWRGFEVRPYTYHFFILYWDVSIQEPTQSTSLSQRAASQTLHKVQWQDDK